MSPDHGMISQATTMSVAVCINCGAITKRPVAPCPICGFTPQTDEEKAKSLMLSLDYEIDGEYRGKTREELEHIAAGIRAGKAHPFDPREVETLIAHALAVLNTPPRVLIVDTVKWLAPTLALLGILYYIAFVR